MKKLIVALALGAGLTFLVLWSLGFRRHSAESLNKIPNNDISWFIKIEGYPQLIYKDPNLVETLTNPEQVIVYRINENEELRIGQYGLSSARTIPADEAEDYSTIICSPTSMRNPSACIFNPCFAIRFERDSESVYALVCYSCYDIYFTNDKSERLGMWGMTNESALALLERFHILFPDDKEVQSLNP